jgi:hypothetical protein
MSVAKLVLHHLMPGLAKKWRIFNHWSFFCFHIDWHNDISKNKSKKITNFSYEFNLSF